MIGVAHLEVVSKITWFIPDYMVIGERGMVDIT